MGPQLYRCGNGPDHEQRVHDHQASMGPQLYRCGNLTCGEWTASSLTRFNGAATLSLRKYGHNWDCHAGHVPASMGPQLHRCGNFQLAGFSDRSIFRASMRPQLYRCRNLAGLHSPCVCVCASMGPQLYRCGNRGPGLSGRGCGRCFNGAATLSLRKCVSVLVRTTPFEALQWGRNFIVAEMSQPSR